MIFLLTISYLLSLTVIGRAEPLFPCDTSIQSKKCILVLKEILLQHGERLNNEMNQIHSELEDQKKVMSVMKYKIYQLESNPVPLGFIYIQLSSQPAPDSLWPNVTWSDVTAEYAGLFLRAAGGGAAPFGEVQPENAPRLTEARIESHHERDADNGQGYGKWNWDHIDFNVGNWSSGIGLFAGNRQGAYAWTHHFRMSGGEVRPRNIAMRVWKRTA